MKRNNELIHSLVFINSRYSHFMESYEFKEMEVLKVFFLTTFTDLLIIPFFSYLSSNQCKKKNHKYITEERKEYIPKERLIISDKTIIMKLMNSWSSDK